MRNKIKSYSVLLSLLLGVSTAGLFLIVKFLDPYQSVFNIILFYLDLEMLVVSLAALLGFQVRQRLGQREHAGRYLTVSLRQAIWFSILILGSLMLQSFGLFNIINAVVLIAAFVFLESYFLYARP